MAVRIYNAGLERAARGSLKIQEAKITPKIAICAPSHNRAMSSQLRHVSTVGQKLVKQQYLLHMSGQYNELRPING